MQTVFPAGQTVIHAKAAVCGRRHKRQDSLCCLMVSSLASCGKHWLSSAVEEVVVGFRASVVSLQNCGVASFSRLSSADY